MKAVAMAMLMAAVGSAAGAGPFVASCPRVTKYADAWEFAWMLEVKGALADRVDGTLEVELLDARGRVLTSHSEPTSLWQGRAETGTLGWVAGPLSVERGGKREPVAVRGMRLRITSARTGKAITTMLRLPATVEDLAWMRRPPDSGARGIIGVLD